MSSRFKLKSVIAPWIKGLLAEKRSLGFSYDTEELILARFDAYCQNHGLKAPTLSRDFLDEWLEKCPSEGSSNHRKRVSVVRQLLIYMTSLGLSVYIPSELPKVDVKLPHIMSADERSSFFSQLDAYRPATSQAAHYRLAGEYKVLFRMIYCLGLRNSEACELLADRVDMDAGVVSIVQSKGRKDRIVYMTDDLTRLCSKYFEWLEGMLGFCPQWFFPAIDPERPLLNTSVDRVFNRLWSATEFAKRCADKPVVHDLRFSFITDRVNLWALDGVDVEAMMPYLSRFVGHSDLESTYYYIHTSEQLSDVIATYDITGSSAIPKEVDYGQRW